MRTIKLSFLVLFTTLLGCQAEKKQKVTTEANSRVDSASYETLNLLPADSILLPSDLKAYQVIPFDDVLVFATTKTKLYVYDKISKTIIDSIFHENNEVAHMPKQGFKVMESALDEKKEKVLWIRSSEPYIGRINLDKYLSDHSSVKPVYDQMLAFNDGNFDFFTQMGACYSLDQSRFIARKSMEQSGKYDEGYFTTFWEVYNSKTNQVTDTLFEHKYRPKDLMKYPLYNSSYSVINPDKSKIAIFPRGLENFSIMTIKNKHRIDFELMEHGFDINYAVNHRRNEVHFGAIATDKLIFSVRMSKNNTTYLNAYNWKGEFKYRINLQRKVKGLSVSASRKALYGFTSDGCMLVYSLNTIF